MNKYIMGHKFNSASHTPIYTNRMIGERGCTAVGACCCDEADDEADEDVDADDNDVDDEDEDDAEEEEEEEEADNTGEVSK